MSEHTKSSDEQSTDPRKRPEWSWIRMEVIIRDDYACQECGVLGGLKGNAQLHVHHLTPVAEGGGNDRKNLLTLCRDCHLNRYHQRKHLRRGAVTKVTEDNEEDEKEDPEGPTPPEGVPNRAYVTIKEPKPGYEYYYWQWRADGTWKNKYIGSVESVVFEDIK